MTPFAFYCDRETFAQFEEALPASSRYYEAQAQDTENKFPCLRMIIPVEGLPRLQWPTLEVRVTRHGS